MELNHNHLVDTEKAYRQHYLKADINLSTIVLLVWLMTIMIFIPVDYQTLGVSHEFYFLLATRLIFSIGSLILLLGIRQTTDPAKYDIFISMVMFMSIILSIIGSSMLKHDFIGQLVMEVLVIISIYAVIPGPIITKITVSTIFSIQSIFMLFKQDQIFPISHESILTGIIMSNILGFLTWYALAQFRRKQFQLHMELQEARKRAEFLARADSLTDASNRRAFLEKGEEEFARARRYQRILSVVVIDLDDFKSINDKHGHQAGDLTLIKFAQHAITEIRKQDMLGRLGGDEFGILLPETDKETAHHIMERVYEGFSKTIISFHSRPIKASISAGIASINPTDESFDALLNRADQKLYQAKRAGKSCVRK